MRHNQEHWRKKEIEVTSATIPLSKMQELCRYFQHHISKALVFVVLIFNICDFKATDNNNAPHGQDRRHKSHDS
jgi:hypothetical protein